MKITALLFTLANASATTLANVPCMSTLFVSGPTNELFKGFYPTPDPVCLDSQSHGFVLIGHDRKTCSDFGYQTITSRETCTLAWHKLRTEYENVAEPFAHPTKAMDYGNRFYGYADFHDSSGPLCLPTSCEGDECGSFKGPDHQRNNLQCEMDQDSYTARTILDSYTDGSRSYQNVMPAGCFFGGKDLEPFTGVAKQLWFNPNGGMADDSTRQWLAESYGGGGSSEHYYNWRICQAPPPVVETAKTADVHANISTDGLQSYTGSGKGHTQGVATRNTTHPDYDANDLNLIHDQNIRADGQHGSHRHQITRYPTPAPTNEQDAFNNMHDGNIDGTGNTIQIANQTDVAAMPTKEPTAYPTKDRSAKDTDMGSHEETGLDYGTICSFTDPDTSVEFKKPVGWVGAGPGKEFCNVWKCNKGKTSFTKGDHGDNQGHFTKQVRKCSVEEHFNDATFNYCSHTTCKFVKVDQDAAFDPVTNPRVIQVASDHREGNGGYHMCGYAKHTITNNNMTDHLDGNERGVSETGSDSALNDWINKGVNTEWYGRPACDCVCKSLSDMTADELATTGFTQQPSYSRRQDAPEFRRELHEFTKNTSLPVYAVHDDSVNNGRVIDEANFDATTDNSNTWDDAYNHNNFYSKHTHTRTADEIPAFNNKDANANGGAATSDLAESGKRPSVWGIWAGRKNSGYNQDATQYNEGDHAYGAYSGDGEDVHNPEEITRSWAAGLHKRVYHPGTYGGSDSNAPRVAHPHFDT